MTLDPRTLAKTILWLAALGLVVIVATRIVGKTAGKAAAQL